MCTVKVISDYDKQLIWKSVIELGGGHRRKDNVIFLKCPRYFSRIKSLATIKELSCLTGIEALKASILKYSLLILKGCYCLTRTCWGCCGVCTLSRSPRLNPRPGRHQYQSVLLSEKKV